MIEFDCICRRYHFAVPADLAGESLQCPECRRLVDVPAPAEADQFDEAGGYKVDLIPDPKALDADLAIRAFTRGRLDEHGLPIDMRQSFEDVLKAGLHQSPDVIPRLLPKYDPETGELIRPHTIRDDEPKAVVPLDPEPGEAPLDAIPIVPNVVDYARSTAAMGAGSMAAPYAQLLKPANLIVMTFILLFHFLLFVSGIVALAGFLFVWPAPALLLTGLFAHYANVIDEIGPSDRDELPVPLRNVSVSEDIWLPFFQTVVAIFLVSLPLLAVHFMGAPPSVKTAASAIALVIGIIFMPAIWLTTVTGGVYSNLRPDRVLGLIRVCGVKYWIAAASLALAVIAYYISLTTTLSGAAMLVHSTGMVGGLAGVGSGSALLAVAIYLMHAAAWQLGLLYRSHQPEFPWIMQRHTYTNLAARNRPAANRSSAMRGHTPTGKSPVG